MQRGPNWDFLRCGGQARTVSPVDVMAVIGSQLTYCVEVAAELLADVEEQTVRSVHQAQRPGRESPASATQPTDSCWPARKDSFSSYRSGFEIRTYRLCRRVLMFHHFPDELETAEYLVRSTEFEYREKPIGSFITRVTQSGYRLQSDARYLKMSLPALELAYTASPLEDPEYQGYEVKDVDPRSVANLPGGIDGDRYRLIDLDGEGISGVLSEQGDAWFWKPNWGDGLLGTTEVMRRRPSLAAIGSGRQQFMDLAGDGK